MLRKSYSLALLGLILFVAFLGKNSVVDQVQAQACTEAPVNVEFRLYTGADYAGWKSGSTSSFKVGDSVDINCFAKNGTKLLTSGKFKIELLKDGKTTDITSTAVGRPDVRRYKLDCAGTYTFTCSNASCSDRDVIVVTGADSSACPVKAATTTTTTTTTTTNNTNTTNTNTSNTNTSNTNTNNNTATTTTTTFSPADIDKNGVVDMNDVKAFYEAFRRDFKR